MPWRQISAAGLCGLKGAVTVNRPPDPVQDEAVALEDVEVDEPDPEEGDPLGEQGRRPGDLERYLGGARHVQGDDGSRPQVVEVDREGDRPRRAVHAAEGLRRLG
jgi:hypothetical protein